ncbi:MAG: hypothetical protein ABI224_04425 [Acetobacteraceae bacterium]
MSTLTVGSGMQYATIASAVAASQDGDVVQVSAGTYKNDWLQINDSITLEAVGGTVTMSATVAPPNNKGIIIVGDATHSPDVTITGIVLTGAKISRAQGNNGARIRYQNGNLTLNNDTVTANQEGLLATPYVAHTGTIIVNNSTFTANGAGDGQSHNVYVNHVQQFTFEDSVSIGAYVGHDIKSRADNTTIINSTIGDGTAGTTSYEIDLPNGGNAIIQGNTIQQGAASQNPVIISYGEEGGILPGSTLTVSGNTVMNDLHRNVPTMVRNSTAVVASIDNNLYYGLTATQLSSGPASLSNDVSLAVEPKLDPTGGGPTSFTVSGNNIISHTGYKHAAVLVTGNSDGIDAGTGGVSVVSSGANTTVVTLAGATDDIELGNTGYVLSSGNDEITTGTGSVSAVASGHDTIFAGAGGLHLVAGAASTSSVVGGAGSFAYSGSGGALDYTAAAGSAYIVAGSGAANVQFGSGATTLNLGTGAADLIFANGTGGGTDVISGFNSTRDALTFQGFAGSAVASQTSSGGSTYLTLTDGTHVTFAGVPSLIA